MKSSRNISTHSPGLLSRYRLDIDTVLCAYLIEDSSKVLHVQLEEPCSMSIVIIGNKLGHAMNPLKRQYAEINLIKVS